MQTRPQGPGKVASTDNHQLGNAGPGMSTSVIGLSILLFPYQRSDVWTGCARPHVGPLFYLSAYN